MPANIPLNNITAIADEKLTTITNLQVHIAKTSETA